MKIKGISTAMVSVPYTVPTTWSKGRGTRTFNLIVRVETDDGLVGWGESVGPSVHNAKNIVDRELTPQLVGENPSNHAVIRRKLELALDYLPGAHWAFSGVEMALFDLTGQDSGLNISDLLGGRLTDSVEYVGYVFIDTPEVNAEQARNFVKAGHAALKMKIGRNIAVDEARIAAVRDAVGNDITIRVDPNAAWTREEAIKNIDRLYQYDIEYVEQPLSRWDIEGLAELRQRSRIPIAVDESCGTFRDAVSLIGARACDVMVVYCSQAGGMFEAKRIADFAAERGIRCVMGSASELGIATLAQAYTVASSAGFRGAVDTHIHLQEDDVLDPPLALQNARVQLPNRPGMGVAVSLPKLKELPVPNHVHAYSLYDQ